jgi:hypothetical protein
MPVNFENFYTANLKASRKAFLAPEVAAAFH